ncbi:sugar diacid recognition domain-containing protein [Shewanella fidelis]|uniref:Helix-turn-helix domain-containing protein n=1 Tax=Shewanella fidelis TaxID=173509 RepID=A0AAW8NMV8_9GAMM|nr:sugar diacid recognition domain-containing protein [Shewanella fidelis]MDR8523209.1 helix-turn-helix domain-containing protein [Shewanella fidelis]MDW4811465.1 helix-turn-helix domain-containing protein [Shewanella fidelis]MDW4815586.1 helix-turn-helix domain-containing protein [Shewanella fidelis]MDW4819676.1 helix-turn-helix domain-containing protein [Shewanella fidelis]MDW4824350.1 helix-turn-helix domain-containing protein [Shewanella fidelis]
MYFLDASIARQIVQRTMKIIGHNINVMNNHGVILGSGDPHRVGEIHEGALLAISQKRTVEISTKNTGTLQGVKPGINLPLHYKGDIIGVIGITGEPEALKSYGELLKMTAELIVEQANTLEQAQWHYRQKEELIIELIKSEGPYSQHQRNWASQLNIDLDIPRVVALIKIQNDEEETAANSMLKQVLHLLENPSRGNLVAMTSMTELVILKPAFLDGKAWDPALESERIDQLLARLPTRLASRLKISLGHFFPATEDLNRSYQTAIETLAIGQQIRPEQNKYLYEDYSLSVLLSALKDSWRGKELLSPYQALLCADKNGQLVKTLSAYLQHFGDLQQCANSLFIHRNTLRYRLDKIQRITGVNIDQLDGLLQLYIGQVVANTH